MTARALAHRGIIRPITLGGFTLTEVGVEVHGRPSFQEYQGALGFANRAHKSSGWWMGDLLAYGAKRKDWAKHIEQEIDASGYSEKTIRNMKYVAENVPVSRRRANVDFTLHADVAALPPKQQEHWLEKAETEGLSHRELVLHIQSAQRRRVIEGQAILEGMFRVIYADPPWIYGDRPPSGRGAQERYPGMPVEEICKLPIPAHALDNSVLFMWVTAPLAFANPGAREVGEAWGFTYKQQIVWDKVDGNWSHYTGGNHELLTIWTRGSCLPDLPTDLPDSVQVVRKSRTHSEKPEEFRKLIEKHWTSGPYLELFGTRRHPGWTVFGNDARLWAREAERQAVPA